MRDDHGRVFDILEAISRIERVYIEGKKKFGEDEMAQVWVIHHLEIIGEAARGISEEFKDSHGEIPWSEMIGMRNILIHQYFGIDKEAVWQVVEKDLPVLKSHFKKYL